MPPLPIFSLVDAAAAHSTMASSRVFVELAVLVPAATTDVTAT